MGEDPQSLENHGFPQISQLVLHSINPSESVDSDGFSLVFITFLGSLFLLFLFDPNRDPYGILSCSLETGHDSLAQSSLEAAGEQVSHGFCRLPLGCRGHVGVSVQGEPGAEVPQHPRHRFHIHPVLQGQGGKCVPLRYNKDKREKPVFSMGLSVCRSHFNSFSNIETDAKI